MGICFRACVQDLLSVVVRQPALRISDGSFSALSTAIHVLGRPPPHGLPHATFAIDAIPLFAFTGNVRGFSQMTVFQTKSIFCGAKAQTYPQDVLDFVKSRKQLKKGNLHSLKNAKFANFKYKILVHLFARRLSLQSVKSMFTKIEIFYFFCHFLHLRRSDNSQSSDYFFGCRRQQTEGLVRPLLHAAAFFL